MIYYGFEMTGEKKPGQRKTEHGVVVADSWEDAKHKIEHFYSKYKIKSLDVWFETSLSVMVITGGKFN